MKQRWEWESQSAVNIQNFEQTPELMLHVIACWLLQLVIFLLICWLFHPKLTDNLQYPVDTNQQSLSFNDGCCLCNELTWWADDHYQINPLPYVNTGLWVVFIILRKANKSNKTDKSCHKQLMQWFGWVVSIYTAVYLISYHIHDFICLCTLSVAKFMCM